MTAIFQVTTPLVSVFLFFWVIKTLILQLWLSLQVETFYQAVKLAQDLCSSILASDCTGGLLHLFHHIFLCCVLELFCQVIVAAPSPSTVGCLEVIVAAFFCGSKGRIKGESLFATQLNLYSSL